MSNQITGHSPEVTHSLVPDQMRPAGIRHSLPHSLPRYVAAAMAAGVFAAGLHGSLDNDNVAHAQDVPAATGTAPETLSQRAEDLITATATAWTAHQSPDGRLSDPVFGQPATYGAPMIGQAMIDVGEANGDDNLISAGLRAQLAQIEHPDNKGFNVGFEVLGLADGFARNDEILAGRPEWDSASAQLAKFLAKRSAFPVGESKSNAVEKCFDDPNCYINLKLVRAFADIQLRTAGLGQNPSAASLPNGSLLSTDNRRAIDQAARNTSDNARRLGDQLAFQGAGILSDPTKNPLAYNALSAMILGQTIEDLGPARAPKAVKDAFDNTARSLLGLMAPDGDIAYIGRGQGQVWNVAATADAMAIAAHNETNSVWRGRYLAAADKAIQRLETVYKPGAWGMPLVPRYNTPQPRYNHKGIDHYANTVEYNGLALFALQNAMQVLRATPDAPRAELDVNGVFVEPNQTKFATVKLGDRWWAVHGSDTHVDARYDFGLVAAQRKVNGIWQPALPYRPKTESKYSAGPVILEKGNKLVPVNTSLSANQAGIVTVEGGWNMKPNGKPTKDVGTKWVFSPVKNGVEMKFKSLKDRTYQFRVWYKPGSKVQKTKNGLVVTEANGMVQKYLMNRPVKISLPSEKFNSAYDEDLKSAVLTTKAKSGSNVTYTTKF